MPHALHFLIFTAAGWLNRRQEDLIDDLRFYHREAARTFGRLVAPYGFEELKRLVPTGRPGS